MRCRSDEGGERGGTAFEVIVEELTGNRLRRQQQPQCSFGNAEGEIAAQNNAWRRSGKERTNDVRTVPIIQRPAPATRVSGTACAISEPMILLTGSRGYRMIRTQIADGSTDRGNSHDNPQSGTDDYFHDDGAAIIKRQESGAVEFHDRISGGRR